MYGGNLLGPALVLLLGVGACIQAQYDLPNGLIRCDGTACPPGYDCGRDGRCWRRGTEPLDAGIDAPLGEVSVDAAERDGGIEPQPCEVGTLRCNRNQPEVCHVGVWRPQRACPPEKPQCDHGVCVEGCITQTRSCRENAIAECDAQGLWQVVKECELACVESQCTGVCRPKETRCVGVLLQTCDERGAWDEGTACHAACDDGACVGACAPGTKRCSPTAADVVETCDGVGAWQPGAPCPYVCVNGGCGGQCKPGTLLRWAKTVMFCDTTGTPTPVEDCPVNCADGACAGACTEGERQCASLDVLQVCSEGEWRDQETCAFVCLGGACGGVCKTGATKCEGGHPYTCAADGTWSRGEACRYVCAGNECGGSCAPGALRCSGNRLEECDATGSWATSTTCTHGCSEGACSPCVPEDPADLCRGFCGTLVNRCEQPVACGDDCASQGTGMTCGGGGVPNVCGCTPQTMAMTCSGKCGPQQNNCGQTVSCASCLFSLEVQRAGSGAAHGIVSSTSPASPAISCGATCSQTYTQGTVVNLSASVTSSAAATFTGWSMGCTGAGGCSVPIDGTKIVVASFDINSHTLTVSKSGSGTVSSDPAGISCGTTCSRTFNHGTSVTLTAQPSTGSAFVGWSGSGCSGTSTCMVSMTQARSVTATFAPLRTLTVGKGASTGTGTITSTPSGISCGSTCSASWVDGTVVTLSAAADPGSVFSSWGGACSGVMGQTCMVTLDAAKSVTAIFTATYTLSVSRVQTGGTGSVVSTPSGISCGTTCSKVFEHGTMVSLEARPTAGSAFAGWAGNCSGTTGRTCVVTMTGARSAEAHFIQLAPPVVTATSGPGGVALGWPQVVGATGYQIFSGESSATTSSSYQWTWTSDTHSSFDPQSFAQVHYVVKAVNEFGTSGDSNRVSGRGWESVARFRSASQLTNYSPTEYPASWAVDGIYDNFSSTAWEANQWWQVDLGQTRTIFRIDVYNRADCCFDALSNFKIEISQTGTSWTLADTFGPIAARPSIFHYSGLTARFVRISLSKPDTAVTLAEVDVWGY